MNVSDIHLMYDYNYWANHLMLSKAAELSTEQLTQPTTFAWGSLQKTLAHLLDSEHTWRNLCQYQRLVPRLSETETFVTLDSMVEYWAKEEAEMWAFLNGLEDSDLESIVRYDIPEGVRERVMWHCLVHNVNHGTQHRSECAAMLTDFGNSPGGIDFTLFLNLRAK